MSELSFSRRTGSERDLQPVAITSVDPVSRTATGITRTRHAVHINCAYATGDTITVPAVGEQWYVERFDMEWRLYGRIPFNDATLHIEPEEGQVSVGSATGPLELNGTEIRSNGKVFRLNGVYYRDSGEALERSVDQVIWEPVSGAGFIQLISYALAGTPAVDVLSDLLDRLNDADAAAIVSLQEWAATLATDVWGAICDNPFIQALRDLGEGDTILDKVITGFQTFINDFFKILFCDFTGDLTPNMITGSFQFIADVLAGNVFIQGLQAVAQALNVAVGNLLNDAVIGATALIDLLWNIITCRWDNIDLTGLQAIADLFDPTGPVTPAAIVDFLKKILIDPVIDLQAQVLTPIIGTFLDGLKQVAEAITGQEFDSLIEGVVAGVRDFTQLIYDTITEILSGQFPTRLADIQAVVDRIAEGVPFSPVNLVKSVTDFFILLGSPTLDGTPDGFPNPVGILFTALGDFWRGVIAFVGEGADGGLFSNAIRAIAEMFSILRDLILVNPLDTESRAAFDAAIGKIQAGFANATAGLGFPVEIINVLGDVLTLLIDNPIVLTIQKIFESLGLPTDGMSLFKQIVDGSSHLIYLIGNLITEVILPLPDDVWETLLPFIPASVWDGIRSAGLGDITDWLGSLSLIVKAVFEGIESFLGLAADSIANFFQNILTMFRLPDGTVSDFFNLLFADKTEIVNYFLVNVLEIAEMGLDGAVTFLSRFIGAGAGVITDLLSRLLAVFGIDFNPVDANGDPVPFNAANAITDFILTVFSGASLGTFLSTAFGGVFGETAAEVTRFFTRLTNLFGGVSFTDIASFDFAGAAAGFITTVLVNAPSTAVAVLQGIVETIGSLAYKVAEAVIKGLRGVPFGLLNGVADFLQGALDLFAGLTRGNINSGTNLLADPGAEKEGFWKNSQTGLPYQTGVSYQTSPKRSGGGSLLVSGGYFAWWNVNDLGERAPIRTQPGEYLHAECYVYSYYNSTVYLYARAENSITGAAYDYYLTAGSANSSDWTKVQADIQMPATHPTTGQPSGWDRVSFGVYAASYPVYVDDMLVREITAAQAVKANLTTLNQALYQTDTTPAGTTPKINVGVIPTGIPATSVSSPTGSGTVGSDIGNVYTTLTGNTSGTGNGGLVATVGNASSGLVATVGNASSGLVNKTNTIITSTFNAWYGSGSSGAATEMGQVVGAIKSTVANTWTVTVLPYGTTYWDRPVATANILEFWVVAVGSGSGGGKGQQGYLTANYPGGIGGAGGKWFVKQINPANVPSRVYTTIAAGGAGKTAGTVDSPNNGGETYFGSAGQAHYVSTAEIQTASIASIIGFYSAADSQPGNGGNGGTGMGTNSLYAALTAGTAGESTPLAAGGSGGGVVAAGTWDGVAGGAGANAVNTGQYRAGGGGGGGGGAGNLRSGGAGGSGGLPGGGGGGGGGANGTGGPVGGNGGSGAHGSIILLYRTTG